MKNAFWQSLRDTIKGLHYWIGDTFKTKAALRRHLQEVSWEPVGEVHVDSLFYSDGMQPERFASLPIFGKDSPEDAQLWQGLRQQLRNLILWQQEEHVREIPLLELSGLYTSKSRGPWKTLAEFGRSAACQGIPCSNDADFQRNMTHSFPQRDQPFRIRKVWWNGQMYWMNTDGSHHAAVAFVQALEQGRQVSIPCLVTHVSVTPVHAQEIIQHFFALVVTNRTAGLLWDVLCQFEVPFQFADYTPAGNHLTLLVLPRSSRKARLIAETILQQTLAGKAFDFTQFLRDSISTGSYRCRDPDW